MARDNKPERKTVIQRHARREFDRNLKDPAQLGLSSNAARQQ
jgi:hypothetical protein